ncbi:MAG: chromosome partitioning protein ParB, partial [Salinibacterium sp.]
MAIAPENVRANLAADAGIPQLWQTIKAAGLLYGMLVRPGKKGEQDHMILDGRRRFLAYSHGVTIGDIPADHAVKVQVETDKNRQLAATLLTASETEPTHLVDIIKTIGVLRARKMKTGAIAEALGYEKLQIDRWGALSTLSDDALEALRAGKLTFRQATLLTKIPDAETQAALVEQARNGSLYDQSISSMIVGARITAADPRVRLVGLGRYTAAGGRVESDLFNETPDILLDPDKLQSAWTDCARPLCAGMKDAGLAVFVSFDRQYQAPEGFRNLPVSIYGGSEDTEQREAALRALGESQNELREIVEFDDTTTDALMTFVERSRAHAQAREPEAHIGAVIVTPDKDFGIGLTYFATVEPEVEIAADDTEAGKVALANDGAASPRIHGGATRQQYEKTPQEKVTDAAVKLVQTPTQTPVTIE